MSMSVINTGTSNSQDRTALTLQEVKYEFQTHFAMPNGTRSRFLDEVNLLAWHFVIRCESLGTLCRTCMNMSLVEPSSYQCLLGVEIMVTLGDEFGQPATYLNITSGRAADSFFSFLRDIEKGRDTLINSLCFFAAADSPGRIRFHMERLVGGLGSFTFYPLRDELRLFFEQQRREGKHWVVPGVDTGLVSFGR